MHKLSETYFIHVNVKVLQIWVEPVQQTHDRLVVLEHEKL